MKQECVTSRMAEPLHVAPVEPMTPYEYMLDVQHYGATYAKLCAASARMLEALRGRRYSDPYPEDYRRRAGAAMRHLIGAA